jgi:hypothetical protein
MPKYGCDRVKFKKAPGAPRRFKSSFMFFSTHKHKEIRKKLEAEGKKEKVSYSLPLINPMTRCTLTWFSTVLPSSLVICRQQILPSKLRQNGRQ